MEPSPPGLAVVPASWSIGPMETSPSKSSDAGCGAVPIAALTGVNYFGIKLGSVVQNIFTILKLLALVALIVAGLLARTTLTLEVPVQTLAPPSSGLIALLGAALIPVLFAYGGWQSTNFVAGEMRDPQRDLPRALILGVLGVVAVYVLANVAYLKVLGVSGLAASTAPASDVMRQVLGPRGGTLIAAGIAASTFGFLNLAILSAPRIYQAMAADGVFFGRAAALHPQYRAPGAALVIQGAWAVLLLATKTYGQLLDWVVFGDWIFFGLVGATVFYYRRVDGWTDGRMEGASQFRTPLYPWIPVFFVTAAAFTVASTVASNPKNAALGAVVIAAGVPAYVWWQRKSRIARMAADKR